MKHRYQLITICATENNPVYMSLIVGTYIPPEGSRVVSSNFYNGQVGTYIPPEGSRVVSSNYYNGQVELLLEFDVPEGEPY